MNTDYPDFKVGDLIKAYHSGIHEVINPDWRNNKNCITYKQVYNNDGKPFKGRTYICHIGYCRLVDYDFVHEEIVKHAITIDRLAKLIGM